MGGVQAGMITSADVAQLYRNAGKEPPAEFADAKAMRKRAEKYGRIRKEVDGFTFDSTSEANAYTVLTVWEAAGAIKELELQPVFVLQEKQPGMRAIKYVADFSFVRDGCRVVVDVKGVKTPAFRIKEKLFRAKFQDLDLQIWDRSKVKEMIRL